MEVKHKCQEFHLHNVPRIAQRSRVQLYLWSSTYANKLSLFCEIQTEDDRRFRSKCLYQVFSERPLTFK